MSASMLPHRLCGLCRMVGVVLAAAMLAGGCWGSEEDYCDGERRVTLIVHPPSAAPTGSSAWRVVLYPEDSTRRPYTFDVRDSLAVHLPDGRYRAFVYNNDSEINRFAATDDGGRPYPRLYTDVGNPRGTWAAAGDAPLYDYPDRAFACYDRVAVAGGRVVFGPAAVTRPLTVVVTGLGHLQHATGLRLVVDGVTHAYAPGDTATAAAVSMVADARGDAAAGWLTAGMHVFGLAPGLPRITLFIEGRDFRHRVDLRAATRHETSEGITLTAVANVDLADFTTADSGLNVATDGWDDRHIEISF